MTNKSLPTGMAYKYEVAFHQLFDAEPAWRKTIIIEEPHGRHASILARQAVILAENEIITARERNVGEMTYDPHYQTTGKLPQDGDDPQYLTSGSAV